MICVVLPTLNAERTLAKALGGLTRAAMDGLVREVVVVDGGSNDATVEVADDAGAEILTTAAERGTQLAAGAAAGKSPWIMSLRQDAHLLPGWETVVARHIEAAPGKAAWFTLEAGGLLDAFAAPRDGVALLMPRGLYDKAGGFKAGEAEKALAGRIGRGALVRVKVPVLDPERA
jgi:glycosyltransferase involved in cell wall biosynthesis